MHAQCPPEWRGLVQRLGGGYFHSPLGLRGHGVAGEPLFFVWSGNGTAFGIAAGVRHGCRLTDAPQHVFLPTLPAVMNLWQRDAALESLVAWLRAEGAAELTCHSLNACGVPHVPGVPVDMRLRQEYSVRVDAPADALVQRWSDAHRREFERLSHEAWTLTMPQGEDAYAALAAVRHDGAESNGHTAPDCFNIDPALEATLGVTGLTPFWGRAVFAAYHGSSMLAAAAIGWANGRAYHLGGGATRAGRDRHATVWLHWQILRALSAYGFTSYGLGGSLTADTRPGGPAHALHRLRMGLGATQVGCGTARWTLDAGHTMAHRSPARGIPVCVR